MHERTVRPTPGQDPEVERRNSLRRPEALVARVIATAPEGVVEIIGSTVDVGAGGCLVQPDRVRPGIVRLEPEVLVAFDELDPPVAFVARLVGDPAARLHDGLRIAFQVHGPDWEAWVRRVDGTTRADA